MTELVTELKTELVTELETNDKLDSLEAEPKILVAADLANITHINPYPLNKHNTHPSCDHIFHQTFALFAKHVYDHAKSLLFFAM